MKSFLLALALIAGQAGLKTNPVLYSDYSDPDVIAVGGEYWMTASSFNMVPGLQILHSHDLVNWEIVDAALPAGSPYWKDAVSSPDYGNGVWAPAIRHHDGRFWIFWGDPDRGIFQVSATDPRGEWTEPVLVLEGRGLIDPCPLWDEDGSVWLVHGWAGSRAGFKSVLSICRLSEDCTRCTSEQMMVYDGRSQGCPTIEGPKIYRRNGWYYIFAPAGGVKTGWQMVLRSRSITGPYEGKVVMHQGAGEVCGPHQGGWITDSEGQDWFLHFEDRYAWGRTVHLQPMEWLSDGWCIIGHDMDGDGIGEPVSGVPEAGTVPEGTGALETGTGFKGESIPLNWQWRADPATGWAMTCPAQGCLRLNCMASEGTNLRDIPNILSEKIVGPQMSFTCRMVFRPSYAGDRAGIVIDGLDYATIEMIYDGNTVALEQRICTEADRGTAESIAAFTSVAADRKAVAPDGEGEIDDSYTAYLKVSIRAEGSGSGIKALCSFSYSLDGKKYRPLGGEFAAREGKWIGARLGLFATASVARNAGGSVEIY